jgi:hypothetical protein
MDGQEKSIEFSCFSRIKQEVTYSKNVDNYEDS